MKKFLWMVLFGMMIQFSIIHISKGLGYSSWESGLMAVLMNLGINFSILIRQDE